MENLFVTGCNRIMRLADANPARFTDPQDDNICITGVVPTLSRHDEALMACGQCEHAIREAYQEAFREREVNVTALEQQSDSPLHGALASLHAEGWHLQKEIFLCGPQLQGYRCFYWLRHGAWAIQYVRAGDSFVVNTPSGQAEAHDTRGWPPPQKLQEPIDPPEEFRRYTAGVVNVAGQVALASKARGPSTEEKLTKGQQAELEERRAARAAHTAKPELTEAPKPIHIYTDGSADEQGFGGWAWVAVDNKGSIVERSNGLTGTTNNAAELTAIYEALDALPALAHGVVHTDSHLCVKTLTEWAELWGRNGWVKADGSAPSNVELVKQVYDLYTQRPNIKVQWIKAHAGHEHNERADKLAGEQRLKLRKAAQHATQMQTTVETHTVQVQGTVTTQGAQLTLPVASTQQPVQQPQQVEQQPEQPVQPTGLVVPGGGPSLESLIPCAGGTLFGSTTTLKAADCPRSFFYSRVLGLSKRRIIEYPGSDGKTKLDAMSVGSLVHYAAEQWYRAGMPTNDQPDWGAVPDHYPVAVGEAERLWFQHQDKFAEHDRERFDIRAVETQFRYALPPRSIKVLGKRRKVSLWVTCRVDLAYVLRQAGQGATPAGTAAKAVHIMDHKTTGRMTRNTTDDNWNHALQPLHLALCYNRGRAIEDSGDLCPKTGAEYYGPCSTVVMNHIGKATVHDPDKHLRRTSVTITKERLDEYEAWLSDIVYRNAEYLFATEDGATNPEHWPKSFAHCKGHIDHFNCDFIDICKAQGVYNTALEFVVSDKNPPRLTVENWEVPKKSGRGGRKKKKTAAEVENK